MTHINKNTSVDDIDVDLITHRAVSKVKTSKHSNTFYVSIWIDGKNRYLHRLIMERVLQRQLLPCEKVDHINGDGTDNRRNNLRLCTHQQNMWNQAGRKGSSSKYNGVTYYKRDSKWQAKITHDGRTIHLGYFSDEKTAAQAYNVAAIGLFGTYARLNTI